MFSVFQKKKIIIIIDDDVRSNFKSIFHRNQDDEVDVATKSPSMSRSISHPARREKTIYRRQSHHDRMTQSMYVESPSTSASSRPNSGVSFFVDLTDVSNEVGEKKSINRRSAAFLKSMSREEADRDLTDVSEDMQVKSQLLVSH